jgi:glucose/arabinose dehydrogenase
MRNKILALLFFGLLLTSMVCSDRPAPTPEEIATISEAATVPSGFTDLSFVSGLSNPTLMEFAPDGRLFVSEQGGNLRVVKNGTLLSTPFLHLSVSTTGERGLLGIAFDPNFAASATEKWVYVYHTETSGPHNQVSRFKVSATNPDVADMSTRQNILDLPATLCTCGFHNGGSIHFGKDGKLYVSVGESTVGSRAQSTSTTMGKMLRINRDGSIPSDNPMMSVGSVTGSNKAIYAMGFRNPFTFAVQPGTGRILVNDVGANTQEEIDDLKPVDPAQASAGFKPTGNYGWPSAEGTGGTSGFTRPIYAYDHGQGCAITGGDFYNPVAVTFPSSKVGHYFFGDYCNGKIKEIDPGALPGTNNAPTFASGVGKVTDIKVGKDGALYYLNHSSGTVRKIVSNSNPAPVISDQPANLKVAVGEPASFTVGASGSGTLAYQWQLNGTDIAGATSPTYNIPATAASDDGSRFRCRVSNAAGSVTSNEGVLTVVNGQRPVLSITAPAMDSTYNAGDTINFAGTATDAEDGDLTAAMTWSVDFYHNDGNPHFHPVMPDTVEPSGSFLASRDIETSPNVAYRITLSATDSTGLSSSTFIMIQPNKVQVTLASDPSGLMVSVDGTAPVATPFTFTGVVGVFRSIGTSSPQTQGGKTLAFDSWSDGGAVIHNITTPGTDTTYTATFNEVPIVILEAENAVFKGPVITTKHPGYTGTGYLDFTNATGDYVEFTVDVPAAGPTPAEFRYANGGGTGDKLRISINGTNVSPDLGFPNSGGWEVWKTISTSLNLAAGTNKVRATSIGAGVPNIDHLKVTTTPATPTPPSITQQPANQSVLVGQNATFTVGATGTAPLTYQWQRDGADIGGATSSSFTLMSAQLTDSGAAFRCVVSNAQGSATSNAATLTVSSVPVTQTLEAETATFTGPLVTTKHPGFTGTGYLDFQNSSGDFVQWTFNVAAGGTHAMSVRFANGGSSTISVRVTVNGVNLPTNLSMPFTGANWEVWSLANFSAGLNAGSNTVRITTIGVGQPNVDNLQVN